jgi:hypothetical protein
VSPHKTKTNQAWAAVGPLKIVRLSTNEKGEAVKEKMSESEIGALNKELDDVLCSGKILLNHRNRGDLLISLKRAEAALSLKAPLVPKDLIEELQKAIEEISYPLAALKRLKQCRHIDDFINQTSKIGDGVVDIMPMPTGPTEVIALVRMQELLTTWHSNLKKLPTTASGAPNNDVKLEIARYAVEFFRDHSAKKPSTSPSNPVQKFAVRYSNWVTGEDCKSLDWQIRKVLEEMGLTAKKSYKRAPCR